MALKDLVADHGEMTEEAIEAIVTAYVRYDPKRQKIIFTPDAKKLNSEQLVLLYLVAVEGWQYVTDDAFDVPTAPANLEPVLGIPGGTLRPTLKKLRESHLISNEDGQYRVQLANLDAVSDIISGKAKAAQAKKAAPKPKKTDAENKDAPTAKKAKSSGNQLSTYLDRWIAEGFFKAPRTMADLLARYHEVGVIAKSTSLSGLLLRAVRAEKLRRFKAEHEGKEVWAYQEPNT